MSSDDDQSRIEETTTLSDEVGKKVGKMVTIVADSERKFPLKGQTL